MIFQSALDMARVHCLQMINTSRYPLQLPNQLIQLYQMLDQREFLTRYHHEFNNITPDQFHILCCKLGMNIPFRSKLQGATVSDFAHYVLYHKTTAALKHIYIRFETEKQLQLLKLAIENQCDDSNTKDLMLNVYYFLKSMH